MLLYLYGHANSISISISDSTQLHSNESNMNMNMNMEQAPNTATTTTTATNRKSKHQLPTGTKPQLRFPEHSTVLPGDRLGTIRRRQLLKAGRGCYTRQGHIYATLVGKLQLTEVVVEVGEQGEDEGEEKEGKRPPSSFVCNVVPFLTATSNTAAPNAAAPKAAGGSIGLTGHQRPPTTATANATTASSYVLKPGQIVLGRVVRITPQNAVVTIHAAENVGTVPQPIGQEGAIRTEDVRALASEQVQINECFQPGDLVAARVISFGDSRRYFLSTAETELGVIRAMTSSSNGLHHVLGSGSLQKRKREEDCFLKPISFKEMEDPVTGLKEQRKVAKPLLLKMSSP